MERRKRILYSFNHDPYQAGREGKFRLFLDIIQSLRQARVINLSKNVVFLFIPLGFCCILNCIILVDEQLQLFILIHTVFFLGFLCMGMDCMS